MFRAFMRLWFTTQIASNKMEVGLVVLGAITGQGLELDLLAGRGRARFKAQLAWGVEAFVSICDSIYQVNNVYV
jgi:hypothetical protein